MYVHVDSTDFHWIQKYSRGLKKNLVELKDAFRIHFEPKV